MIKGRGNDTEITPYINQWPSPFYTTWLVKSQRHKDHHYTEMALVFTSTYIFIITYC